MFVERCFVAPKGVPKLINGFGRTADRSEPKFLRKANLIIVIEDCNLEQRSIISEKRPFLPKSNNVDLADNRRIIR
jgi:hypothetical protein